MNFESENRPRTGGGVRYNDSPQFRFYSPSPPKSNKTAPIVNTHVKGLFSLDIDQQSCKKHIAAPQASDTREERHCIRHITPPPSKEIKNNEIQAKLHLNVPKSHNIFDPECLPAARPEGLARVPGVFSTATSVEKQSEEKPRKVFIGDKHPTKWTGPSPQPGAGFRSDPILPGGVNRDRMGSLDYSSPEQAFPMRPSICKMPDKRHIDFSEIHEVTPSERGERSHKVRTQSSVSDTRDMLVHDATRSPQVMTSPKAQTATFKSSYDLLRPDSNPAYQPQRKQCKPAVEIAAVEHCASAVCITDPFVRMLRK